MLGWPSPDGAWPGNPAVFAPSRGNFGSETRPGARCCWGHQLCAPWSACWPDGHIGTRMAPAMDAARPGLLPQMPPSPARAPKSGALARARRGEIQTPPGQCAVGIYTKSVPGMVSLMWVVGHREMAYDHPPDDNMSNPSTLTIPDHEGWSPWVWSPKPVDSKPTYADFACFRRKG